MRLLRKSRKYIEYAYYSKQTSMQKIVAKYSSWRSLSQEVDLSSEFSIITPMDILYRNIPFGSSIEPVVKKMGEPKYMVDNTESLPGHMVAFYRLHLGKRKVKTEIHFLNNSFFYAKYCFSSLSDKGSKEITQVIKEKYNIDFGNDLIHVNITGSNGNCLNLCTIDRSTVIKYICIESESIEHINKQSEIERELSLLKTIINNRELFDAL